MKSDPRRTKQIKMAGFSELLHVINAGVVKCGLANKLDQSHSANMITNTIEMGQIQIRIILLLSPSFTSQQNLQFSASRAFFQFLFMKLCKSNLSKFQIKMMNVDSNGVQSPKSHASTMLMLQSTTATSADTKYHDVNRRLQAQHEII